MGRSEELMKRAEKYIPGGVNSPVRAYRSVGMTPRFIQGATGSYIFDVEGNKYIDYICSWGPMILGHKPAGDPEKGGAGLRGRSELRAPRRSK